MANTLADMRNKIQTSIFGRRLGLDTNDMVLGMNDFRRPITDLTSASTGTAIPAYGTVNISGTSLLTSGQLFLLSQPVPGASVTINNVRANATAGTTGCTSMAIVRGNANMVVSSSEYSSGTSIILAEGMSVTLLGVSTAIYQVTARVGAVVTATT